MKPEMVLLLVVCVAILVLSAVGIYLTGTERPAAVRKLFVPGFSLSRSPPVPCSGDGSHSPVPTQSFG